MRGIISKGMLILAVSSIIYLNIASVELLVEGLSSVLVLLATAPLLLM
jgi:energy-converting hydrogenase Eha subunit C